MRLKTSGLVHHLSCCVPLGCQRLLQVYIIEANPRASRTVPFVAKAVGHPLAKYASLLMAGQTLPELGFTEEPTFAHVAVKEAVLPFEKFPGQLQPACKGWRHPAKMLPRCFLLQNFTGFCLVKLPEVAHHPTSLCCRFQPCAVLGGICC